MLLPFFLAYYPDGWICSDDPPPQKPSGWWPVVWSFVVFSASTLAGWYVMEFLFDGQW